MFQPQFPDEMIGAFTFDGIKSQSFGCVSKSVKRPAHPSRKVRRVDLPFASGVYDFEFEDERFYNLYNMTFKLMWIGKDYKELRIRARQIAAWLIKPLTWTRLILDDEPDVYYMAKVTEELDVDSFWQSGSIDVTFDCQPVRFSLAEQSVSFSTFSNTFYNPGTMEINYKSPLGSKFEMLLDGSSVTLNGKTLLYNGDEPVLIDNIKMEANCCGKNAFHCLDGDIDTFLKIVPGDNHISSPGKVSIDYIPLWY